MVRYQSIARPCENQPLESTSAINIGRGRRRSKIRQVLGVVPGRSVEAQPSHGSPGVPLSRGARIRQCQQAQVPGVAGSWQALTGSICLSQPVTAGDGRDLFTDKEGHGIF